MSLFHFSKLKLININYRYPNTKNNVLNNVNLTINQGEIIGIKGISGAGKTTLVDIISGLLQPSNGNILVNDKSIVGNKNYLNRITWSTSIAYVPQNIFLSDQSIINNVAFGIPDELIDIKKLTSATAIMNVKKDAFYVNGHFPENPVMPGVLIVEAFGQAAAALTAHGINKEEYKDKLVFLMSVEKARFRNPVIPDCKLELKVEAIRSHGRVWKYKGEAYVEGKRMADAQWSATIVDKK